MNEECSMCFGVHPHEPEELRIVDTKGVKLCPTCIRELNDLEMDPPMPEEDPSP